MKKFYAFLALSGLLVSAAVAQSADQNSKRTSFGLGLEDSRVLVGGNFDYAVADNLFLGVNLYLHAKAQVNTVFPTIRASYYFNNLFNLPKDNIDLYAGIGASKAFSFYKGENESTDFYFPVHVGGRYFIKEQLGVFAEFIPSNKMIGTNTISVGITLKR